MSTTAEEVVSKPTSEISAQTSSNDPVKEFVVQSQVLSKWHRSNGVLLAPYTTEKVPHFAKLPEPLQIVINSMLKNQNELFSHMQINNEKLTDTPRLLWRSLKKLGWTPLSDLFDKIGDGDVVELYTIDQVQIFRNLNFFKYVSLTLEEVVSFPLSEKVSINEQPIQFWNDLSERARRQEFTETEANNLEAYIVEEKMGQRMRSLIQPKWISPIFENEQCMGAVIINRVETIN